MNQPSDQTPGSYPSERVLALVSGAADEADSLTAQSVSSGKFKPLVWHRHFIASLAEHGMMVVPVPPEPEPATVLVPRAHYNGLASLLDEFDVVNYDGNPWLRHSVCGEHVCMVEAGDDMSVLLLMCIKHRCNP